jgi:hypothetical protein
MIPINGSFNVVSSVVPSGTAIAGNVTLTTHVTNHPYDIIITAATSTNTIRTAPFLFLKGTPFSDGTRIVDTKSSIKYAVSSFTWAGGVLTINHATIPVAAIATQKIHISGASNANINGIFSANAAGSTTVTTVTLASDPGSLAGVTGLVQPGIIDVDADNRGYYTINLPVLTTSTAALTTPLWAINTVPSGATHAILVAVTNTNYAAQIVLDGVAGVVFAPANQFICLKNLQSGRFYRSNGTGATDLARVIFCTLNPLGNT